MAADIRVMQVSLLADEAVILRGTHYHRENGQVIHMEAITQIHRLTKLPGPISRSNSLDLRNNSRIIHRTS